jgi:hypothetical protein
MLELIYAHQKYVHVMAIVRRLAKIKINLKF